MAGLDPLLPLANIERLERSSTRRSPDAVSPCSCSWPLPPSRSRSSVVGVYGVLAYLVSQRRREIGVRLAVGASSSDVVWLFLREGAALTLIGLGVGLAGALAAGRWISALLFAVTPADPVTLAIVVCALAGAAACATYLPARRAARVDPGDALRTD